MGEAEERGRRRGDTKRGRPQRQTTAPLGILILSAMRLLGLSYKDIVAESEHLATLNNNVDMRAAYHCDCMGRPLAVGGRQVR